MTAGSSLGRGVGIPVELELEPEPEPPRESYIQGDIWMIYKTKCVCCCVNRLGIRWGVVLLYGLGNYTNVQHIASTGIGFLLSDITDV